MDTREPNAWTRRLRWILPLVLLVAIFAGVRHYGAASLVRGFLVWVDGLGAWGPLVFVIAYTVATVAFLPGFLLTLGAGFLFGVVKGTVVVSAGSTLGATLAFLLGRSVARDWVQRKIAGSPRFQQLDEAVAREGWRMVALMRLSPVFPFNLLNYAFGLTKVSLRDYVLASWLGMLPATVLYVYAGSLARSLAELGSSGAGRGTAEWILYGVGLVATVLVVYRATVLARRTLRERLGEEAS
ncbi:MAG: TVP38/TMEM64 family protein [Acidobacteriota bacterium]